MSRGVSANFEPISKFKMSKQIGEAAHKHNTPALSEPIHTPPQRIFYQPRLSTFAGFGVLPLSVCDYHQPITMSGVDPSFEALLAGVLSHDNNERKNAEVAYNQGLETQPAVIVANLMRCLENGQVTAPPPVPASWQSCRC